MTQKAKTTSGKKSAPDKVVNVMFRGIPKRTYQGLKVQAAKKDIYLKDLIVEYLEAGLASAK